MQLLEIVWEHREPDVGMDSPMVELPALNSHGVYIPLCISFPARVWEGSGKTIRKNSEIFKNY
jgi:hypothetical protein